MTDITLTVYGDFYFIAGTSMAGLMWLQMHFPDEEWDYIAKEASFIDKPSATKLVIDAEDGGMKVSIKKGTDVFIPGFHD